MAVLKKIEHKVIIFNKYSGSCAYCGNAIELSSMQVDHLVPKRRGVKVNPNHTDFKKINGSNSIENLMPSCRSCNSSKHDWTIEEWRSELNKRLERLNRDSSEYRTAKRFGMIEEINKPIVFHFEKYHNA